MPQESRNEPRGSMSEQLALFVRPEQVPAHQSHIVTGYYRCLSCHREREYSAPVRTAFVICACSNPAMFIYRGAGSKIPEHVERDVTR